MSAARLVRCRRGGQPRADATAGIGDFDQRVSQRMLERAVEPVGALAASRSGTAAASPMRPSASAATRWTAGCGDCQRRAHAWEGAGIPPQRRRMQGRLPHGRITIVQRRSARGARLRVVDARERPDGVAPRHDRDGGLARASLSAWTAPAPRLRQLLDGPLLHGRPRVAKQLREPVGRSSTASRASGRADRAARRRRAA